MWVNDYNYFSYHVGDSERAMQVGLDLLLADYPVWIDFLCRETDKIQWQRELRLIREPTQVAIVLWSDQYATSAYCQDEFNQLVKSKTSIVLLENSVKNPCKQSAQVVEIIPFQPQSFTNDEYEQALTRLMAVLDTPAETLSNEQEYLIRLLHQIELRLIKQPTAKAIQLAKHVTMRPRLYRASTWLTKGDYDVAVLGDDSGNISNIGIQDVNEWLHINPQLLIHGEPDTGKSSVLLHITRSLAHQRLLSEKNALLPVFLDLQQWQQSRFSEYVDSVLNTHFAEQPDNIIYIIDDIHRSTLSDDKISDIQSWVHGQEQVVLATDSQTASAYNWQLPQLRLNALSDNQVYALSASVLPPTALDEDEITSQTHELDTLAHQLLLRTVTASEHLTHNVYANIIDAYLAIDKSYGRKASSAQLKTTLQYLALLTVQENHRLYLPHDLALACVREDMILQQALALGLLERFDDTITFASENLRRFLAASAIYDDGIYAHIGYPVIQSDGILEPTSVENFVRDLPALLPHIDVVSLVDTTATIDPYLAIDYYTFWQVDVTSLLVDTLRNLFSLADSKWSLNACSNALQPLIERNPAQVATAMLRLLDGNDTFIHERVLKLIASIWKVPDTFYSALADINTNFPDAVLADIDPSKQAAFIVALIRIAQIKHSRYRLTVLTLLGNLRVTASTTLLQSIIWNETGKVRDYAIDALIHIDHNKVIQTLLYLVADAKTKTARESAINDLSQFQRQLSGRLLMWLSDNQHLDSIIDVITIHSEVEILSAFVQQCEKSNFNTLININLPQPFQWQFSAGEASSMKALLDAIAKKMSSLEDQPSFESFLKDVLRYLKGVDDKPQTEDILYVKERLRNISRNSSQEQLQDAETKNLPRKLLLSLKHSNWIIRRKAVERLATYPPKQSLELLLEAARDEDLQVRTAAIEGFPLSVQDERITQILLDSLLVDDFLLADTAATRIRDFDNMLVPQLLDLLDEAPLNALALIFSLLGASDDERAVGALKPYLEDDRNPWLETKSLGELAATALLQIGTDDAISAIQDINPQLLESAPQIILPDVEDIMVDEMSAILAELQSDDWMLSQEAAKRLREYAKRRRGEQAQSIAQHLVPYLKANNWTVRWAVIEALAWLQVPETIKPLTACLNDNNWTVQIATIRTLMELDARDCNTQIAELLNSNNSTVREAVVEALGVLQSQRSVNLIKPALSDEDSFVRLAAVKSLIAVSGREATELLMKHEDDYHHVRWHIAQYLTSFNARKLLPIYIKMLADDNKPEWEDQTVRELAEIAISKIDTDEAKSVLKKWQQIRPKK